MPSAKRNSASKIVDGRQHNGRKKGDSFPEKIDRLTPSTMNKAKKGREKLMAINAIREEYGSEEEFWRVMAKHARKSFAHAQKIMEYAYGKPGEARDTEPEKKVPVINFYTNEKNVVKPDETIDIPHEEN